MMSTLSRAMKPSRLKIPTFTPSSPRREVAITATSGHLAVTREGTWAFFQLADLDWDGVAPTDRDDLLADVTARLVDITGHRVWLRGTSAPWDPAVFRRRLDRRYPAPIPDQPGGRTRDELHASAAALGVALRAARPVIIIGARFTKTRIKADHLPWLVRDMCPPGEGNGLVDQDRQRLRAVTRAVEKAGMQAERLSGAGLQWVVESSIALGHAPAPIGDVTAEDIPASGRRVRRGTTPMGSTTPIHVVTDRGITTRHVTIRHVAAMKDRDTNEKWPFLAWLTAQQVEWAACFDLIEGRDLVAAAEYRLKVANDSNAHDAEHGVDRGEGIRRGINRSREVIAEVAHGSPAEANRAWGRIMVATSGDTPQDALDAMTDLASEAERHQDVALEPDWGVEGDVWRFVPGEPWDMTGHLRRLPLTTLAALGAGVTGVAGDREGCPLGAMVGSSDMYVFDPHGGPLRNRPGTIFVIGEQGSGKTSLASLLIDWETSNGGRGLVSDPSGKMARLAKMPHLSKDAAVFPLTTAGKPGMLMPHFLDPEPKRRHYPVGAEGDEEFEDAVRGVAAVRMDRAIDAVMMCLPQRMIAVDDGSIQATVENAVGKVGGRYGTHSREIIDAIRSESSMGGKIADQLDSRARLSDGAMIFPDRDVDDSVMDTIGRDAALTVVTMPGLSIPQSSDRSTWTREQHRSVPILILGWQLAARSIWADTDPKMFFADELGVLMGGFSSIKSSILRLAYDSRKFDAAAMFAAQTGGPISQIDPDVDNLVGAMFMARTSRNTAEKALPLLGQGPGSGWDHRAPRLDDGEFIVSGWDRKPRQVRADQAWWHPDLLAATDTTPSNPGHEEGPRLTT